MCYILQAQNSEPKGETHKRGPGRKNGCSLIGSKAQEFSVFRLAVGLKEGKRQVTWQLRSLLDASTGGMPGQQHPQQRAVGMPVESRGTIRQSEPQFGREEWSMKTRIVSLLALASLILAFAFIATAPAAPNKANVSATAAASALPATPAATPAEKHPEIREALESLRRAKEHLEHAAHDFGGHRVEAIEATDRAIRQLELCLKFDKD
jgi:hypothetical protein